MNFIHPFRVQLIGPAEIAYLGTLPPAEQRATFARLLVDELGAVFICGIGAPPDYMVEQCDRAHVPLMQCPHPSPHVVDVLRLYLSRMLAANAHCMASSSTCSRWGADHQGVRDRQSELALEPSAVAMA